MTRMGDSDITTQQDLEGMPRHLALVTGALTYQMRVSDQVMIVTSSGADAAGIVTLPSLAEAVGRFYFISAPTGATGGDISLYEKETGSELATNGDMDADDDHLLLFSDGQKWRTILDGVV